MYTFDISINERNIRETNSRNLKEVRMEKCWDQSLKRILQRPFLGPRLSSVALNINERRKSSKSVRDERIFQLLQ